MKANTSLGVSVPVSFEHYAAANSNTAPQAMPAPVIQQRSLELGVKRAIDITLSLTALVVLLPLLLAVALLIKLESPGPVFFRQARWGQGCRIIHVFKFRSMRLDQCDATGVRQTVEGDPRITRTRSATSARVRVILGSLFASARSAFSSTSQTCTLAPSFMKARATSRPMPLAPAVTSTRWPFNLRSIVSPLDLAAARPSCSKRQQ